MISLPIGVFPCSHRMLTIPQEARDVLEAGRVLAFRLAAHLPGPASDEAPSWYPGVDVCVDDPEGPVWHETWSTLKGLDIPGLTQAMVALSQPFPCPAFFVRRPWKESERIHGPQNIFLTITGQGNWMSTAEPSYTFRTQLRSLERAAATSQEELGHAVRTLLKGSDFAVLLIQERPRSSAHTHLSAAVDAQKLLDAMARINAGGIHLENQLIPFTLPTADDLDKVFK